MAYEDFTTYTEVDPSSDITVTSSKCDVDTMAANAGAYVRDDKGVNQFTDFEHLVTGYYGAASGNYAMMGIWGLSNGANSYAERETATEGLSLVFYQSAAGAKWVLLKDHDAGAADYYVCNLQTIYYFTVERSGTTLTCKIYSDANRTDLLDTLSLTCTTLAYRYAFGTFGGENYSATITGYSENLDLQNQAPTAPTSLECEGATNPLNVTDPTPEFTAIGHDPDTGDTLTHASIEVDDDSGFGSPIWQSGWIDIADFTEGNRCAAISYAGGALMAGIKYWWRIKFKDIGGLEGAWSDGTDYFYIHSYGGGAVTFQDPGIL